jgi:hypothetical protein
VPKVPRKVINSVQPHLIHSTDLWKDIWHFEGFNASLKFLYELFYVEEKITTNQS